MGTTSRNRVRGRLRVHPFRVGVPRTYRSRGPAVLEVRYEKAGSDVERVRFGAGGVVFAVVEHHARRRRRWWAGIGRATSLAIGAVGQGLSQNTPASNHRHGFGGRHSIRRSHRSSASSRLLSLRGYVYLVRYCVTNPFVSHCLFVDRQHAAHGSTCASQEQ